MSSHPWLVEGRSFGELRADVKGTLIAGIEPMHGNELTVYTAAGGKGLSGSSPGDLVRTVLASDLNQGHALAVTDLLGTGSNQIVTGWREPNKESKVGIKLFFKETSDASDWNEHWIDDNGMACEDLQVADLNGDGKPDIIAAGRATKNLKIYWNKN